MKGSEMESKRAGDIMIPLDMYPHIPYWFTVREAIAIIHHSQIEINGKKSLARAVLVFDEEYKLLGMVRRRDILRGLDPESIFGTHVKHSKQYVNVEPDPEYFEISLDAIVKSIKTNSNKPVSDMMTTIDQTVDSNDHIMKIIYEMNKFETSMLPVLKDDVVVGVIRTVEVLNEIGVVLGIE